MNILMTLAAGVTPSGAASEQPNTAAVVMAKTFWERWQETGEVWGRRVLLVAVIMLAAWFIAGWVRRIIRRVPAESHLVNKLDMTVTKFVANLARWAILVMAAVTCLGVLGVQTASFAAVIAAAGLAIGLAFQGSLSNLASGVMLLIFRPFKVGDSVIVAGQTGIVNEIDLFMTELDTPDGRRIVVPNSQIVGSPIENTTHHPRRRADLTVVLDSSVDVSAARGALERATSRVEGALKTPGPEVALANLVPGGSQWTIGVWADRSAFGPVKQSLLEEVKKELESAGMPMAVQSMVLKQG